VMLFSGFAFDHIPHKTFARVTSRRCNSSSTMEGENELRPHRRRSNVVVQNEQGRVLNGSTGRVGVGVVDMMDMAIGVVGVVDVVVVAAAVVGGGGG